MNLKTLAKLLVQNYMDYGAEKFGYRVAKVGGKWERYSEGQLYANGGDNLLVSPALFKMIGEGTCQSLVSFVRGAIKYSWENRKSSRSMVFAEAITPRALSA